MNLLPNAGAHLGNIDIRVVKVRMPFIEPLDHRCHFATGGIKGEGVMTMIVPGMKHLGPVRVKTQIIAFEPLRWISSIFFDLLTLPDPFCQQGNDGYWFMGSTVVCGFKVKEGVFQIISGIVPFNPGNDLPCANQVHAMANFWSRVKCHKSVDFGLIGQCHCDCRRIKFNQIVKSCQLNVFKFYYSGEVTSL
jgi:hypothetical protein